METVLLTSLGKIYPDSVKGTKPENVSILSNERYSFQIAYRLEKKGKREAIYPVVETDLPIAQYRIGYIPVLEPCPEVHDTGFDRTDPGLYPDPLFRRNDHSVVNNDGSWQPYYVEQNEDNLLVAVGSSYQGIWFEINENEEQLASGDHTVTIKLYSSTDNSVLASESVTIHVIGASLPDQEVLCTNWFYYDCLSDHYNAPMFSERHFEIIASFLREAAKHGQNMVLLPAFTPPLDTSVGKERKTAQLVKVIVDNGKYSFDFSLLERFLNLAVSCGITHFEHNHMFTQWGATSAPKVIATVDGTEKRIFGWETDAGSEEYEKFVIAYFKALFPVLDKLGLRDKIYFHTSDEPVEKHLETYRRASTIMRKAVGDGVLFDALSHYRFMSEKLTDIPVVAEDSADLDKFIEDGRPFWVYYTGDQTKKENANRLISYQSVRNRMIGIMMYSSGAKGFLHWGYNFYYDRLSHGRYDPNNYTGTYRQSPGASFIVYPSADGKAVPSLRMKVFNEGMTDYRALSLYAKLTSHEKAKNLIAKNFGDLRFSYPMTEEELQNFRRELNSEIEKSIQ